MTEKVAKMKIRNPISIVIAFALVFAFAASCRKEVKEPSPVGPSTFAEILKVSANPNVIAAGNSRKTTNVIANFQKLGAGVEGKTIYFEIGDASGNKLSPNVGFFEGQQAVASGVTDGGGNVYMTYFGPLSTEVAADDQTVYIWAKTALQGNDFVSDNAPLHIVPDLTKATLIANAYPNVLFATAERPQSVIKAVARSGTNAIANRKVFFSIDSFIPGYFGEHKKKLDFAVTNSAGEAEIIYYGPRKDELGDDINFDITVRIETNSPETPPEESLYVKVFMKVVKQL
jgi:hypothetical protein